MNILRIASHAKIQIAPPAAKSLMPHMPSQQVLVNDISVRTQGRVSDENEEGTCVVGEKQTYAR